MAKSDGLEVGDELGGEVCKLGLGRWLVSNRGRCRRCATHLRVARYPTFLFIAHLSRAGRGTSGRALQASRPGAVSRLPGIDTGYQIGTFCVEGTPPNPPTGVSKRAPGGGG